MEYRAPKNVKLIGLDRTKYDTWIGLTEDGFWTTGHYCVIPTQKYLDSMPAVVANKERNLRVDCIVGETERYREAMFDHITQKAYKAGTNGVVDLLYVHDCLDSAVRAYVQRPYVDVILSRYPDAVPHILDGQHYILFICPEDGFVAGLVMPFIPKAEPLGALS